jgi:ATP-dependent RNA helicase DBP3
LQKGFEDDIRSIINMMPSTLHRQTLMFTATWPSSVQRLAASFMTDAVKLTIGRDSSSNTNNPDAAATAAASGVDDQLRANTSITQIVEVISPPRQKEQRMLELLREHQSGARRDDRILLFCLYKKEAARVERMLCARGFRAAAIHGDLSQAQRSASLDAFRAGRVPLLVATDVAARGLDIPAVKLVLNLTFPLTVEDYVHRIGR